MHQLNLSDLFMLWISENHKQRSPNFKKFQISKTELFFWCEKSVFIIAKKGDWRSLAVKIPARLTIVIIYRIQNSNTTAVCIKLLETTNDFDTNKICCLCKRTKKNESTTNAHIKITNESYNITICDYKLLNQNLSVGVFS